MKKIKIKKIFNLIAVSMLSFCIGFICVGNNKIQLVNADAVHYYENVNANISKTNRFYSTGSDADELEIYETLNISFNGAYNSGENTYFDVTSTDFIYVNFSTYIDLYDDDLGENEHKFISYNVSVPSSEFDYGMVGNTKTLYGFKVVTHYIPKVTTIGVYNFEITIYYSFDNVRYFELFNRTSSFTYFFNSGNTTPSYDNSYSIYAGDFGSSNIDDLIIAGYNNGYNAGYSAGLQTNGIAQTIFSGILSVAFIPINFFLAVFNFEILGIHIGGLVTSLLTVMLVMIVLRFIKGNQ